MATSPEVLILKNHIIIIATLLSLFIIVQAQSAPRHDIPGLCYHQVEPKASGKFSLSVEKFREQLQYLKSRNYQALNSDDLEKIFVNGGAVPDNPVVITFDDGYRTVFDHALPLMREFGFKGIVCIYPSFIGSGKAMNWEQLRMLIAEGWSVEAHSMTHANLSAKVDQPELENKFLQHEIVTPKRLIEEKLGNRVRFMVWPYGCYTLKSIEVARKAGYIGAMTVDGGSSYASLSPFQLKRQVVYANDDMNKFLIRLGMRSLTVTEQSPAPGEVLFGMASFSCRLPDLGDYSPEKYVLNAKLTGKKVSFNFDNETRLLTGQISTPMPAGNFFIDVYLREKSSGITAQHGWLFTVGGGKIKESY